MGIRSFQDGLLHNEFATLWLLNAKSSYKSGQLNTLLCDCESEPASELSSHIEQLE
jgi:hypothetical protein